VLVNKLHAVLRCHCHKEMEFCCLPNESIASIKNKEVKNSCHFHHFLPFDEH